MSNLVIQKRLISTAFGTWKWRKEDHQTPLRFQLDGARSEIYVEEDRIRDDPLQLVMHLMFVLVFEGAPDPLVKALKSRGLASTELARRVYDYFLETMTRLEAILRIPGKVRNLMTMATPSIHGFYDTRGWSEEVTWQIGDQKPIVFKPRLDKQPRGRFALYKHPQLVTVEKWKRLQHEIDAHRFPSEDIVELHRLAGKVYPRDKRLPVVEAAILIEAKLKTYAEAMLPTRGLSANKVKDLKDELTFNTVLNLVLPLTLTTSGLRKVKRWLPLIDRIRKLRNDIVHNKLADDAIQEKEVLDGIFAAADLFEFIETKLKA